MSAGGRPRAGGQAGATASRPERIYFDAAPVIYAVEQVPGYAEAVDARLSAPDVVLVTSDLTRRECRIKPLRDGDTALLADIDTFFADTVAVVVPLTREVVDRAAELRATYSVKTPDALHLAALVSQCDTFLTNDYRIARAPGIVIEVVGHRDPLATST